MKNADLMVEASIGENFFAPKCIDRDEKFDIRNAHAIANTRCNFKCRFCKNGLSKDIIPDYMSINEFKSEVDRLITKGKMFKFTGGEPCMNPNLEILMEIVKNKHGIVFLDTNGSIKMQIIDFLNKGLIDVLGISLKGLTPEAAMKNSGIQNQKLVWNNPLEVIKRAADYNNVRVIVTYVAYDDFSYKDLCDFAKILENISNKIYLKVNNLCGNIHRDSEIKPLNRETLSKMMKRFVSENNSWKDKTILINSSDAVTEYSKIEFN